MSQQQQQQHQQQQQQQQVASQPIYCHHPHSHAAAIAAAQHQHAIYHQQQQQQQYGTYSTAAHHQQHHVPSGGSGQQTIYQQIPQHMTAITQNGGHVNNPHSIYQPLVAVSQGSIYVSNLGTIRRQNSQQNSGNPQIPAHHHMAQAGTAVQMPPSSQHQQMKSPQDVLNISRTEAMDTAIYDRDKGIYKCSTLRQGGKFDPKYKPSILNCPLPEIPKDADPPHVESIYDQQRQHQHQIYSKQVYLLQTF